MNTQTQNTQIKTPCAPTHTHTHPNPTDPHGFQTWHRDKRSLYSFSKDENTINTVSRELEVIFIRAAESCVVITADSGAAPGCRRPFVFQTPALPLSLHPHLTSLVYLCLSASTEFISASLTTSTPPIYLLHQNLYFSLLFFCRPLNTLGLCLFCFGFFLG